MLKRLAGAIAESRLFSRARELAERNRRDWNLSLGRWDNLFVSIYLIFSDYAAGKFPPKPTDLATAYENEKQYGQALDGVSPEAFAAKEMRKPFWDAASAEKHLGGFVRLFRLLESLGVTAGGRLLELGCGSGWLAELFVLSGYDVVATTLAPSDASAVESRAVALRAKGVTNELRFILAPMETESRAPCRFRHAQTGRLVAHRGRTKCVPHHHQLPQWGKCRALAKSG
jgi:SAM-dependent methyltransferase